MTLLADLLVSFLSFPCTNEDETGSLVPPDRIKGINTYNIGSKVAVLSQFS